MWIAKQEIPGTILAMYGPAFEELRWFPVSGGFSGARVWRGDDAGGVPRLALKQWPTETTPERLTQIHDWMSQAAHLPFVPSAISTLDGTTTAQYDNRIWDATEWLLGHPCIPAGKSLVESACSSVAELHACWSHSTTHSLSPGIKRRIEVLSHWNSSSHPSAATDDGNWSHLFQLSLPALQRMVPIALHMLSPLENAALQLQTCIRDLRGEHVLFEETRVTGIVDYGALAIESPAFDLARLLGDLVGEDSELFALGLKKYRDARPSFECSDRFVRLLDRVGVVCSLIGWVSRFECKTPVTPTTRIADRLLHLIVRAEQMKSL